MAQETQAANLTNVSDADWETVVEESGSPISFENVGDQFIGEYLGRTVIEPEGWKEEDYFPQFKFKDTEGNVRTINGGYKLNESLELIAIGSLVRITRTPDVELNDPGKNAMKDYKIEVAKK
jgi:hypothetical protein